MTDLVASSAFDGHLPYCTTSAHDVARRWVWEANARPEQLAPPGDWLVFLALAGRGWGKSRCGAEWVNEQAKNDPNARIALVGRTVDDVRGTMVLGESGIMACSPPWFRPVYVPSKRIVRWPNGAQAATYSADKPDQLAGPQHTKAWCDEAALWRYSAAWDQLMFGLRLGAHPQVMATTTPRATPWLRALVKDPSTVIRRGSTYDNAANLAPSFLAEIRRKYEGTRLGRQELRAELLDDVEGALWTLRQLDALRLDPLDGLPAMRNVVVSVDPSESANKGSAEAGIVVCGMGEDGYGYALADRSGKMLPTQWARRAVNAFYAYDASEIVAEMNAGGEMVKTTIASIDPDIPVRGVYASKSKKARAEPVSALYEQKKVRHVSGLVKLESQMVEWDPALGKSPDRIDALVHGMTRLFFGRKTADFSEDDNEAARRRVKALAR